MKLTTRIRNIISGLCALVLLASATTIGIKYSFGYYDPGMELVASFDSAGQGLIEDSDVKMRGLNVGHVQSIDLIDGHARVVLFIDEGTDVPRSTVAVIRPKTLFGEKFVDLVPGRLEGSESASDVYVDGDTVDDCSPDDLASALGGETDEVDGCTVGAVELERVLAQLYPILQAVDPENLATILDELATGAEGTGEAVNRSLVNGAALLEVQAANNANTAQFLEDLALLTDELATRAPDLVGAAQDLNVALPVLTENAASFNALLVQLERLSTEAAELLEGNTAFIDAVYTDGQVTLDTLFANREQLLPLVVGLGSYLDILGRLGHISVGDGSFMAAVKGITGGPLCTLPVPVCSPGIAASAGAPAASADAGAVEVGPSLPSIDDALLETSTEGIVALLGGLLEARFVRAEMIRTAIKFAIFGVVCLALTLWLAFVIGNREFGDPLGSDNFTLTARFDDVTGLLVNDEVKIAGVEVGKVTAITTEGGRALVTFDVRNDYRDTLPIDTEASIRWRNLIGQRFLYLVPGSASTMLEPDDEICAEVGCDNDSVADLGELFNSLGPIVSAIDEGQVNDFLETFTQALDGNADRLGQTLADLATLTEGLAGRDAAISSLLEDLNTVAGTLTARDQQIRTLLDNLVVLAQTFSDNTDVVDQSLIELSSFSTDLSSLIDANQAEIQAIITNLDTLVDTEVVTRLTGLQQALDGVDEASRAVFNAGRNGEWLNQDILCASVLPPPCPTPINLVPDLLNATAAGADAPDPNTGTQNIVAMLTGGTPS